MSLVNDALKKARHEQAVQEAREKGLPDPLPLSYHPYRPKSRTPPLVAALAVGLLVLAAAGATWFLAARTPPAPTSTASPATSQPVPQAPPPTPKPASLPLTEDPPGQATSVARAPEAPPAESAAPASPFVEKTLRQGTDDPAAQPAPPPTSAVAIPTRAETAPRPEESGVAPAAPAAAVADGAVFRRKMPLPDGTTLELGGIAFSDVAPFAYLNGRLVGVGEGVAGWRIVAIERTGVRLSDGTTTVRIDLK
ncbi:MAG: hypothetical protein U0X73_08260 [Thermoanaerobaculia bacterium]